MIEQLIHELNGAGYKCFVPLEKKSCFDIAAKGKRLLLLKILPNIDSLRESQAKELKSLAAILGAIPLVIGEHSKSYQLEAGLVYDRYRIAVISHETLRGVLNGLSPRKRFYKGRIVAEIDGSKLAGISPTELAKELHVTRETIYSYRQGGKMDFEKAKKVESLLDKSIIRDIDLFLVPDAQNRVLDGYLGEMQRLGFDVVPVHRGFDALATKKEALLVDAERSEIYAKRKTTFVKNAAEFFGSHPLIVMESSRHEISGVPIVSKKEIGDSESAEGLIDLVKKRRKE